MQKLQWQAAATKIWNLCMADLDKARAWQCPSTAQSASIWNWIQTYSHALTLLVNLHAIRHYMLRLGGNFLTRTVLMYCLQTCTKRSMRGTWSSATAAFVRFTRHDMWRFIGSHAPMDTAICVIRYSAKLPHFPCVCKWPKALRSYFLQCFANSCAQHFLLPTNN